MTLSYTDRKLIDQRADWVEHHLTSAARFDPAHAARLAEDIASVIEAFDNLDRELRARRAAPAGRQWEQVIDGLVALKAFLAVERHHPGLWSREESARAHAPARRRHIREAERGQVTA